MQHSMQLSDGYTDVPAGKIANVVTCLEMRERAAARPVPSLIACTLERVSDPNPIWYRALFRGVGEPYLWFSRLTLTEEQLKQVICNPSIEIYAVRYMDNDEGLLELDFRQPHECELSFFGLTHTLMGQGIGRWLMNQAIELAWKHPIKRFWVHTCTHDHPSIVGFYMRSGFRPFKQQVEIADDPRLTGILPRNAAPHIPLFDLLQSNKN